MKHTFLYTFMESVSHWKSQYVSIIKHHQENKKNLFEVGSVLWTLWTPSSVLWRSRVDDSAGAFGSELTQTQLGFIFEMQKLIWINK